MWELYDDRRRYKGEARVFHDMLGADVIHEGRIFRLSTLPFCLHAAPYFSCHHHWFCLHILHLVPVLFSIVIPTSFNILMKCHFIIYARSVHMKN